MMAYRSVIVGCGSRARWHAQAYRNVQRGTLVACCDLDAGRREAFASEFGLTPYADVGTMLSAEMPDLVHVVTPPRTRVPLLTLVADAGVPACLVEKPIATEVRDWQALVGLLSQTATKIGVNAQFRYHPDLTRCREALRSGELGDVRLLEATAGGTICDQGVHVIDWAMSLIGDDEPVWIFGATAGVEDMAHQMHPSPSLAIGEVRFGGGARALWHLGRTAPRVLQDPAYYKHCRVAAYADCGHVLYEEFGRWEIVGRRGSISGHVEDRGWEEGNHLAQAALTEAMFTWLEDDKKPVGTCLNRALIQWNTVLGLYASTVWRRPVELPFDPPDDLWERLKQTLSGEEA